MAGNGTAGLHVAIIGAGIGGLALAMALHNKGVPFTLYEEAKEYSAVGAGIGFGPNGMQALDMIEPRFRERYEDICVGNKSPDARNVFFEGALLRTGLGVDEEWYGHSSWGHPDYIRRSAHRKALLDIMTSFIPLENVRFNKKLSGIREDRDHPGRVVLEFADGESAEANVLVGSDGIQSVVREHVLGPSYPNQIKPVYADSYCYRGVIPIEEAEEILGEENTGTARFYFGDKRSCVTYRISGGREFNFLLCVANPSNPWPDPDAVTEKVTHEEMLADFEGHDVDERFVRLLSKVSPIRWGFFHHKDTPTYYRERTLLAGDSAHGSLPFQAAGAAQGVEDALVLSELLRGLVEVHGDSASLHVKAALEAYDATRRPRAQEQVARSEVVARMLHFQDAEMGDDMSKILERLQDKSWFEWLWFHDLAGDVQSALGRMEAREADVAKQ